MRHNVTLAHLQGYFVDIKISLTIRCFARFQCDGQTPCSLLFVICKEYGRHSPTWLEKKLSAKSRTVRYRPNRERKMYDFVITQRNSLRQNAHAPASKQNVLLSSSENDTKKTSHARDSSFPRFCCAYEQYWNSQMLSPAVLFWFTECHLGFPYILRTF